MRNWFKSIAWAVALTSIGKFLMTLDQFPPSGTAATYNLSKAQKQIEEMSKARAK